MKRLLLLATIGHGLSCQGTADLISQGKPVTGSGYYADAIHGEVFPYSNVNDGRLGDTGTSGDWSFWLSGGERPCWVEIDLESVFLIDSFAVQNTHNRSFFDRGTRSFSIDVSGDGTHYTRVLEHAVLPESSWSYALPWCSFSIVPEAGRYVRFWLEQCYANDGGINELAVYGRSLPGPFGSPLPTSTPDAGPLWPLLWISGAALVAYDRGRPSRRG